MKARGFFRWLIQGARGFWGGLLEKWDHPAKHRRPGFEEFRLQRQLENRQSEIRYLQFQLAKTRAEKYELEQKPFSLRETIAGILNEPEEHLRSAVRFDVRLSESGADWEVVTTHCCLGGCGLDVYAFRTERNALLFAQLLDAVGYRPRHNTACPACNEEYMKDCI